VRKFGSKLLVTNGERLSMEVGDIKPTWAEGENILPKEFGVCASGVRFSTLEGEKRLWAVVGDNIVDGELPSILLGENPVRGVGVKGDIADIEWRERGTITDADNADAGS
jgi:hypothetical protein